MEDQIESLRKEIDEIKKRNYRVEADKAWETSFTRRILLMIFTYLAIGIYMCVIAVKNPWLNAIVPTIGFMLSTLSLPFFKRQWIDRNFKK